VRRFRIARLRSRGYSVLMIISKSKSKRMVANGKRMTTTDELNREPLFYGSLNESKQAVQDRRKRANESVDNFVKRSQTNPRYEEFRQGLFHAGDVEQFEQYREATNGSLVRDQVSLEGNLYESDDSVSDWDGYENVPATASMNTFLYIFNKFKKGIFVKIADNKLRVFLPFSKSKFRNEWGDRIKVDPKNRTLNDFLGHIAEMENRGRRKEGLFEYTFNPNRVSRDTSTWYANNCILRYDYPMSEGESNVQNVRNMLVELCEERDVPNIEFFLNRRDFPLLKRDGTEPYDHIWDSDVQPLVSHSFDRYLPVLSMSKTDRYADVTIPTHEDWARVQQKEGKWFTHCTSYANDFSQPWESRKAVAVFRGGSTGCGVTIDTNTRLKLAHLSSVTPPDAEGVPYLDAGITNWNLRSRKTKGDPYLRTIEIDSLPFGLLEKLSPKEQAGYKYVVNVDGHVSAFRLSLELSMGSVILLVDSEWKIWYRDKLEAYVHYVPVRADLSDLVNQIKWCREHDAECEAIAKGGMDFFDRYLQKKGLLDYMQKALVDLRRTTGEYLYNTISPLELQIRGEAESLMREPYPETKRLVSSNSRVPAITRCYGLFRGVQWVVNLVIAKGSFEEEALAVSVVSKAKLVDTKTGILKDDVATQLEALSIPRDSTNIMFRNKLGVIRAFDLAAMRMAVKTTNDSRKRFEHIHEGYVGTRCLNEVAKDVPNFAYIFGTYETASTGAFNVIMEKIPGDTLDEYIGGPNFKFDEYLFILLQICLALQVAQNSCAFVHWDLTPWNIVLMRTVDAVEYDYIVGDGRIYRLETKVVPVIIDYGKSHVVHEDVHHGFVNMYHVSAAHDMLTILLTSIKQIRQVRRLSKTEFGELLRLANFVTRTDYRREPFTSSRDLRDFLDQATRYTKITARDKGALDSRNPMMLFRHIQNLSKQYRFRLWEVSSYRPVTARGNSMQVFEYILSENEEERNNSFKMFFKRLASSDLPRSDNLLFTYYAAQTLYSNLLSVGSMLPDGVLEEEYASAVALVETFYRPLLDQMSVCDAKYSVAPFAKLEVATFGEDTFLLPDQVTRKIREGVESEDLSDYKDIVEKVLGDAGPYMLPSEIQTQYKQNFGRLLRTSSLVMKNNAANLHTLRLVALQLYTQNIEVLGIDRHSVGNNLDVRGYIEGGGYLQMYEDVFRELDL
jgi:serine/threonine protein kinase